MKTLITTIFLLLAFALSAQSNSVYRLNGVEISKSQIDSLETVHGKNLKMTYKRESGKTIVDITIPSKGSDSPVKDRMVFKRPEKSDENEGEKSLDSKVMKYFDLDQAEISKEAFAKKLKEGLQMRYEITGNEISSFLVSKAESDETSRNLEAAKKNFEESVKKKDFSKVVLTGLNNQKVRFDDLKNQVVVLNLWYTGCKPCIAEMPELNELKKYYEEERVSFVGSTYEDQPKVEKFLDKRSFEYLQTINGGEFHRDLFKLLSPESSTELTSIYPLHLVIDMEGRVRYSTFGATDDIGETLKGEIEKILAEK